jgi:uncharacterized membrane protein YkvI
MPGARDGATWFQRFVLPGLAFKAVVIGGGYATGRELAEFFLANGPWGGLAAALVAMLVWSIVCAATFRLAVACGAYDYRQFFIVLLGRGWVLFEIAYSLFIILILSVYGAAAGAIGQALFAWAPLAGTLLLAAGIALFATFGNRSVEALFKWVSILLYCVYGTFLVLVLTRFGGAIGAHFGKPLLAGHWLAGGIAYASYNVVGAVVILPVLRHLTSPRDAAWAGLVAGPLAMAPAIAFFIAMTAFYPAITAAPLPSEMILQRLDHPLFHLLFQLMIFAALLESGTGAVHAVNERVAGVWRLRYRAELPVAWRVGATAIILLVCVFLADRLGLVMLIARGYRLLAGVMLAIFIVPLLARPIWSRWFRRHRLEHNPA